MSPAQEAETESPPGGTAVVPRAAVAGAPAVAEPASELPTEWLPSFPVFLTLPAAALAMLGLHLALAGSQPKAQTLHYTMFLGGVAALSVAAAVVAALALPVRLWLKRMGPIFAATLLFLGAWEVITAGMSLLPMPYFPPPAGVLQSFMDDFDVILDSTWHSLILLLTGYAVGVVVGLVTGICIGWSVRFRYWGMPVLKVLGPIPATAWIPLAMVVSPDTSYSAVGLIAIAVWFPVSMLTASGVANTRASFLDVARTLGAGRAFLIFRVAIPAAMPNIFVGLFMGLGASFLTLVVGETVGVKSGLGWYVAWAQGWAEYGKVYAALIVMAVFFSTIMSLLFKVRDKVLVWQKGMIRW
ncbi:MAG TPA: ABC transporter permease subunit [Planctomycetota bacterium]|nr:ABC transporter permease subunit [Planctomycetota bacterium]